jgi:pyruvate,water dikinase
VWCRIDPQTGAVREAPLPAELRGRPCLEDGELLALCERAERIEREEGVPQDLEWAIDRTRPFPDGLVILQHRPETTVAPPPPAAPAAGGPAYDPVQYALSKVFKVPGA